MSDGDNQKLFEQACQLIPGGVNSPVRAFGSVGGTPRFISRAEGCRIFDIEGKEYIDFVGSWDLSVQLDADLWLSVAPVWFEDLIHHAISLLRHRRLEAARPTLV